jgi:hypothetical protein
MDGWRCEEGVEVLTTGSGAAGDIRCGRKLLRTLRVSTSPSRILSCALDFGDGFWFTQLHMCPIFSHLFYLILSSSNYSVVDFWCVFSILDKRLCANMFILFY